MERTRVEWCKASEDSIRDFVELKRVSAISYSNLADAIGSGEKHTINLAGRRLVFKFENGQEFVLE